MRIARVEHGNARWLARVESDDTYTLLLRESDHPAADALREALQANLDFSSEGLMVDSSDTQQLSPLANPSKVLAVALNYRAHVDEAPDEARTATSDEPVIFQKSSNSVVGPLDSVSVDSQITSQLDYEGELAVVLGQEGKDIPESEAMKYVFGYTVANDLSARDLQFRHKQWYRGKSLDGLAPLGPVIVTRDELDPHFPLVLRTRVNGTLFQKATTDQMIHDIPRLISFISQGITLLPGDVILTGTPGGVGFVAEPPHYLGPGDVVEVEIDRVGCLRNAIVSAAHAT